MNEDNAYYENCKRRERNKGLFVADQVSKKKKYLFKKKKQLTIIIIIIYYITYTTDMLISVN